ncbi:hypothetical protein [Thermotoga sp. KOL6]|uniref:hypothetical protein n=1 Tax=Thermotoga sp. KOL6 TaxID=126741 RepID=UPI000C755C9A|nr:hypothetical protein [Thermotoga sp. KOL6]PLV58077.1 hypothetical protein AS005_08710 [Thermotoga sp. KOL6]
MFGRFPIYVEEELSSEEEKWGFVLSKVRSIDSGVASFLEEAPDGTLRIIGPFKARKGYALVLSSPFPPIFRFLVLNIPTVLKAVVKPGKAYVEILEKKDLFEKPGLFILKVKRSGVFSINQLKRDMRIFLGETIDPLFIPISMKTSKGGLLVTLKTLNPETTALVKFSRFVGVGENRKFGCGDVEIYKLIE